MIDPAKLYPVKYSYQLCFENTILDLIVEHPSYYNSCYEFLFEQIKDLLLSNMYLTIVNVMRYHRNDHLNTIVNDIYESSLDSACADADEDSTLDPLSYTDNHRLWDYLFRNETVVKTNLFHIADRIILRLFHPLHEFVVSAKNLGMYFSDYTLRLTNHNTAVIVTCMTHIEVIKKYDQHWYDRLSMLAAI